MMSWSNQNEQGEREYRNPTNVPLANMPNRTYMERAIVCARNRLFFTLPLLLSAEQEEAFIKQGLVLGVQIMKVGEFYAQSLYVSMFLDPGIYCESSPVNDDSYESATTFLILKNDSYVNQDNESIRSTMYMNAYFDDSIVTDCRVLGETEGQPVDIDHDLLDFFIFNNRDMYTNLGYIFAGFQDVDFQNMTCVPTFRDTTPGVSHVQYMTSMDYESYSLRETRDDTEVTQSASPMFERPPLEFQYIYKNVTGHKLSDIADNTVIYRTIMEDAVGQVLFVTWYKSRRGVYSTASKLGYKGHHDFIIDRSETSFAVTKPVIITCITPVRLEELEDIPDQAVYETAAVYTLQANYEYVAHLLVSRPWLYSKFITFAAMLDQITDPDLPVKLSTADDITRTRYAISLMVRINADAVRDFMLMNMWAH